MRRTGVGLVACGLLLWGLGAQAASIGTGLFGRAPYLMGVVKPGDAAEVATDFAGPLQHPLTISIDPQSIRWN